MSMGHIKANTAYVIAKDLLPDLITAVLVAITGYLVKYSIGKFLSHGLTIVIIVAQMDDGIGLDRIDAPVHKGSSAVGIRKDQNSLHKLAPHFIIV
jgi:hypothetical protein